MPRRNRNRRRPAPPPKLPLESLRWELDRMTPNRPTRTREHYR